LIFTAGMIYCKGSLILFIMNKFFEFSPSQLKIIAFLSVLLVTFSVIKFIRSYSETDRQSLKLNVNIVEKNRTYTAPFIVDINRTPADSLELLPGIGPVLAGRIVSYRDSIKFKSPRDILNVGGIGWNTYEKIKPYIEVGRW